ncbi:MAG: hypothetical protein KBF96_05770 [Ignavibacteria bacterium]|jgi:hypothetical protein|nr:hypothetical protein [Ignavibacteria bacterium]
MATKNQINYLEINKDLIKEPVLIVGSKLYDYDKEDIRKYLNNTGLKDITGIDLFEGEGVDHAVDITDTESEFIKSHRDFYSTIICMEILTNVLNPFTAAENIKSMLKKGGSAVFSECFVRKISKMPVDLWRFTYDGTKQLFSGLEFIDNKARISFTRDKDGNLSDLPHSLPQVLHDRHMDESMIGYMLRRIHRKYFAKGIFKLSRLIPETTIYSVAKKQ